MEPTLPRAEVTITVRDFDTGRTTTLTYPKVKNLWMDYLRSPRDVQDACVSYRDQLTLPVRVDNPVGILMTFAMLEGWHVQIDDPPEETQR